MLLRMRKKNIPTYSTVILNMDSTTEQMVNQRSGSHPLYMKVVITEETLQQRWSETQIDILNVTYSTAILNMDLTTEQMVNQRSGSHPLYMKVVITKETHLMKIPMIPKRRKTIKKTRTSTQVHMPTCSAFLGLVPRLIFTLHTL